MSILSFLKKGVHPEGIHPKGAKKEKLSKEVKKSTAKKPSVKPEKKAFKMKDKEEFAVKTLEAPLLSEKSTFLSESNKYVFRVKKNATKNLIKKAIEGIYNVKVLKVNIIHKPAKKRRLGKSEGFKSGFKKAVVTLKKGDKINIFEGV